MQYGERMCRETFYLIWPLGVRVSIVDYSPHTDLTHFPHMIQIAQQKWSIYEYGLFTALGCFYM